MKNVGLIGLGAMGVPMAKRLYTAGLLAGVYNRTRSKADSFQEMGVFVANSPADLARRCEIIISIVSDDQALKSIMFGAEGVLRSFTRSGIILEMSTTSIEALEEVVKEAEKYGVDILDAPVSGIPTDAEQGNLTVMVGGRQETFNSCLDIFKAISTSAIHVGGLGSARQLKYANNMLVAINLMGALEVTSFIKKTAVDPQKFAEVIKQSRGNSWAFGRFIPGLLSQNCEEHRFTLNKDLDLALRVASDLGVAAPFTSLAKQYLQAASSPKLGDKQEQTVRLSSLVRIFECVSGVHIIAGTKEE